jgi:hypothetical protein
MANGDDFDPRLYPDLFADEELDPVQMAWLMGTMMNDNDNNNDNNNNNDNDNDNNNNGQKDESNIDDSSNNQINNQSNLFAQPTQNQVALDEDGLMNNPELMQMLLSLPPEMLMNENNANQIGQLLMNNMMNTNNDNIETEQPDEVNMEEINRRINEPMIVSMNQPIIEEIGESENYIDNIQLTENIINNNQNIDIEVNTEAKNKINEEVIEEKVIEEVNNPHVKHKKSRCNLIDCKAKVGLLGFDCRCGYTFCSKHRYTDVHFCTYDHKTRDKNNLKLKHERVVADRVPNRI